jgi:hypothetical protein
VTYRFSREIIHANNKDRLTFGEDFKGIGTTEMGTFIGKVCHITMFPGIYPRFIDVKVSRGFRGGHPHQIETQTQCSVLDGLGKFALGGIQAIHLEQKSWKIRLFRTSGIDFKIRFLYYLSKS